MSWSKDLGDYFYTRFPITQFIPLAIFLSLAGLAVSSPAQPLPWLVASILSLSLVLQFRIWDDIADRDLDRVTHPERVLPHTQYMHLFFIIAAALFVMNGILVYWYQDNSTRAAGYLVLSVSLLTWYRLRPNVLSTSLLNSLVILAKYSVIAWLISSPVADTDLMLFFSCLFSVYLIFIIFEVLDDTNLQQQTGARFSFALSFPFLILTWIYIALLIKPHSDLLHWLIWIALIFSTLILGISGMSFLRLGLVNRSRQGFFVVGLLAYLTVAVESKI